MQISKTFKFEMAHRVLESYTTRCQGLHGHSYKVTITLEGSLDKVGMVMDFKEVKDKIGGFLDTFDHTLVVWEEDERLVELAPELNKRNMIVPYNITAENMAIHILYECINESLPVKNVVVYETETGCAKMDIDYINEDQIDNLLEKVKFNS